MRTMFLFLTGLILMVGCQSPTTQSSTNLARAAAAAATVTWKGHVWDVTGAEPIGAPSSGQINGNQANVSVDANGYLHLKITKSGSTFTGAQLFTQDNLGFGTYQFQIEGDLANLEKGVVLGLFPYGPTHDIGVDGENEIDIEFSKWNDTTTGNNADFTYYPPTGYGDANYTSSFESNFAVNFGGATLTTSRIIWGSTSIDAKIMTGLQPVGTTANVISPSGFYSPSNPSTKVPQVALPVGLNLWTYGSKPTKTLDIVIRDFQFVPAGSGTGSGGSNVAPSGTGYIWTKNTAATANTNRVTAPGVNDGNLSASTVLNAAGENGAARWEGAGVVWASTHSLTSVKFINGQNDGNGNGYFQTGFKLQTSTDGASWSDSSWTVSPTYPFSASAYGQTYTFTGATLSGLRGVRVVGQTGASSWSGAVSEVQALGN